MQLNELLINTGKKSISHEIIGCFIHLLANAHSSIFFLNKTEHTIVGLGGKIGNYQQQQQQQNINFLRNHRFC